MEWFIIDKADNKDLIISKNIIDFCLFIRKVNV